MVGKRAKKILEDSRKRASKEVEKILEETEKEKDFISFLRKELEENKALTPTGKTALRKILIKLIKEKGEVKLKSKEVLEYDIVYDTVGQGLEPVYFWTLDFMTAPKPTGALQMEVNKVEEDFEASVGSAFFSEMGQRAGIMQDRAMKLMETVNTVVRSIINLIYDLKEFKTRLDVYDAAKGDKKNDRLAAELALKQVWLDTVDMKKGRGAIHAMGQQLEFVTLRDAFIQAKSVDHIEGMDLNTRVKNILKPRLKEFFIWRVESERELRKRYQIERGYLRTQADSLKLYTQWAKPFLKAAQKLGMHEFKTKANLPSPELVAAFNNMVMELRLFGKKRIPPETAHKRFGNMKFKNEYYSCLDVGFKYRSIPTSVQGQYLHRGTINVKIKAYVFTEKDVEDIEKQELFEGMDLVDNLTDVSLKELYEDIDHYITEAKEEGKEKDVKKKEFKLPFGNIFEGFQEGVVGPAKGAAKEFVRVFKPSKVLSSDYAEDAVKKAATDKAVGQCVLIYDIFKKGHRMVTW